MAPAYPSHSYGSRNGTELYAAVLSANAINMALDIMIFLLPIPLLFRRDTSRKTKVGLLVLFGLGIAINVIAGLRLVTNHVLNQEGDKADLTYDFVKIFVLGEAENRLSCILGSIPVFWPVVSQKIQEIFITREFRVESTYHISLDPQRRWKDDDQPQPYKGKQGGGHDIEMQSPPLGQHGKGGLEYQEDEVLETGLRHPGRLVDVDNYTRAWIGPFAEDENMQQPVISEVKAEKSSGR
ncbi:hypothetical protein N8I77_006792 [Diaporthe amygdali]|uniref:Rhodopsin domain-containing protein n=1 Tax=Phomopsis amygdali TaxID=1214568 RepID=A0AAD9SIH1_PHOAM|nr:hypothetical protein N8I77_006792 [Diaporthe amygdali]